MKKNKYGRQRDSSSLPAASFSSSYSYSSFCCFVSILRRLRTKSAFGGFGGSAGKQKIEKKINAAGRGIIRLCCCFLFSLFLLFFFLLFLQTPPAAASEIGVRGSSGGSADTFVRGGILRRASVVLRKINFPSSFSLAAFLFLSFVSFFLVSFSLSLLSLLSRWWFGARSDDRVLVCTRWSGLALHTVDLCL
jgi:hypothetical protein